MGGTPPVVHVVRTSVSQVLLAVAVDALRGDALSLQRHAQGLAARLVGWGKGGKHPPKKPAAEPPSRWPLWQGKSIALSRSLARSLSLRYI